MYTAFNQENNSFSFQVVVHSGSVSSMSSKHGHLKIYFLSDPFLYHVPTRDSIILTPGELLPCNSPT